MEGNLVGLYYTCTLLEKSRRVEQLVSVARFFLQALALYGKKCLIIVIHSTAQNTNLLGLDPPSVKKLSKRVTVKLSLWGGGGRERNYGNLECKESLVCMIPGREKVSVNGNKLPSEKKSFAKR